MVEVEVAELGVKQRGWSCRSRGGVRECAQGVGGGVCCVWIGRLC